MQHGRDGPGRWWPAIFTGLAACALLSAATAWAQAPGGAPTGSPLPPARAVPEAPPTRGQLLYQTHCIACHNSQMHWRDGRIVRDWDGLVAQVRRWQERATLQWSEADVLDVARHLNRTIYRLPQPGPA